MNNGQFDHEKYGAAREADLDLVCARNSGKWDQAVAFLRKELAPDAVNIKARIAEAPDNHDWAIPYHFYWGMAVRNLLRGGGFMESDLHIRNLDNVYIELVEEAMR